MGKGWNGWRENRGFRGNLLLVSFALGAQDITQWVGWIDAGQSSIKTLEFG